MHKLIKITSVLVLLWGLFPTNIQAQDMCTIIFYDSDGTIAKEQEVACGQKFEIPYSSKEGYNFLGYNTQADGSGVPLQSNIAEQSLSYYPIFQPLFYTVTYYVDNKIYKQQEVSYGQEVENITPPSKEGYTFIGWSDTGKVASNIEVYAKYQPQEVLKKELHYKRVEVSENLTTIQKSKETEIIGKQIKQEQQGKETKEKTVRSLILGGSFIAILGIMLLIFARKAYRNK